MKTRQAAILVLFLSLSIAIIQSSCSSLPKNESNINSSEEAIIARLDLLVDTDPEQCIAVISNLFEQQREKNQSFEASIIGQKGFVLFSKAIDNINILFRKAVADQDILAARRLSFSAASLVQYVSFYDSLRKMVSEELSIIASPAMRLQLALWEAENKFKEYGYVTGKAVLSMAYLGEQGEDSFIKDRAFSIEDLKVLIDARDPKEYFSTWATRAKENNDPNAEAWFESLSSGRIDFSLAIQTSSQDWLADAVSSVVTVYVDRGFKVQGGYSIPDRVLGTAFQISEGLYLTNYHVVQSEIDPTYKGYSRISIRPSDNPQIRVPAKVLSWDEELDLALIKSTENARCSILLPPPGMRFHAGDRVFAVGSPIGLENSITAGVVSSLSRKIISFGEAAQIDVPVNQGNSGSPLFSENGVLVGMVFAGLPSFQNINFALPVQWISLSLPSLFEGKEVVHARLGLIMGKGSGQSPLVLADLDPSLSAFRAGDILKSINGKVSKDIASIQFQLASVPKGALCFLEAQRDFQPVRRLRQISSTDGASLIPAWDRIHKNSILEGLFGARLIQLKDSEKVGGLYSVQWVCPAEAADEIGLSENDVITVYKFRLDPKNKVFILEFSAKSRLSGYFERTIHLEFSSDSATII
ncbi:MAG TPA: trypsin-like peptidase domain-containing protein [Rectinema sp.]|jgi:S1-C subfamily serine protease|nr:trypsin-like peptidase domain-containing protein [Rectinema sp.]HQQ72504.1 trypsin-like peptidase domain-containing protein [Rectinema sp.]